MKMTMNALTEQLLKKSPELYSHYCETYLAVKLLLDKFAANFPTYTDHSISHTEEVQNLASLLLTREEIENLNSDELYILTSACILHDVGMCIPPERIEELCNVEEYAGYLERYADETKETFIRDIHHELSFNFIKKEFEALKIPTEKYAHAIALVAKAHRKVDLQNFEDFAPRYFAKSGRESVCLPYLGAIIRIADELDVTNIRTPKLLLKYYLPDNETSIREFQKHQSLTQINFQADTVIIEAVCTDQNILAAIEELFQKIKDVIANCQKVIRSVAVVDEKRYSLSISKLEPRFVYRNFDPKGIKYSFDVKNVITAFVGKDLYGTHTAALREGIQNAIDACNYRKSIEHGYEPILKIIVSKTQIKISDNGQGMDEFIIEHYFAKLASSFYEKSIIKSAFEAIGQFGIGVFAYFLIADYIEMETKNQSGKSLKFRTDQDPSGYFHFFDGYHKESVGTTLTFHLKDEYQGKINFKVLEKYIKKNFKFINIDIELIDDNISEVYKPNSFELNYDRDFIPRMYHGAYDLKKQFILLSFQIITENAEGEIGIPVPANKRNVQEYLSEAFDHENYESSNNNHSEIYISQKGVLVNYYSNSLSYVVGHINLKKKLNITLNREQFRDKRDLLPHLQLFEYGIIEKFFIEYLPSIKVTSKKDIYIFSMWFLNNIIENFWSLSHDSISKLAENILFNVKFKGKEAFLSVAELSELTEEIAILDEDQEIIPELQNMYVMVKRMKNRFGLDSFLMSTIKYGHSSKKIGNDRYIIMSPQYYEFNPSLEEMIENADIYKQIIYSDEKGIFIRRESGSRMFTHSRFNVNSPFSKFLINNQDALSNNTVNFKILKEVLGMIEAYVDDDVHENSQSIIKKANLLFDKLKMPQGVASYKFKAFDLQ